MIINGLSYHLHMATASPLEDKATTIKISVDIRKTSLGIEVIEDKTLHFSSGPSEQRRVIYDLQPGCVNEQGRVLAKYRVESYSRLDYFPVKNIPNIDAVMQMADHPLQEELQRWIQ